MYKRQAVSNGAFRADLYYRINVVSIFIPPLRDRREDIPLLIEHFLDIFNRENRRSLTIKPEAMNRFLQCSWPGNVRELENCVERTATMTQGDFIQDVHVQCQQNRCMGKILHTQMPHSPCHADESSHDDEGREKRVIPIESKPFGSHTTESSAPQSKSPEKRDDPDNMTEKEKLIWAMEQCGWVQAKAARVLNLTPRQIAYALTKHNIEIKKF